MPIIHKIGEFYKNFYKLKKNIDKINRYGIYKQIEELILIVYEISIEASLSSKNQKVQILQKLRIKIEVIKKLVRLINEINVIDLKKYLNLEKDLIEISKMATSWQKYFINKES